MAVSAPPRGIPRVLDFHEPERLRRVPVWASTAGLLVFLIAVSAVLRTHFITGQFWEDEAITTGIASHSLSAIPGVLRHDGSPPLFYLLLHIWMSIFGSSEAATHSLSLVFGLLCIPAGMWAAWSLFGRRAGVYMAILCAFSTFLTAYAQESRMYELMALLGILATAAFLHGFLYRRRRYLIMFAICEALMLYTHAWGIFFGAGSVIALIPIWLMSEDRRGLVRDAVLTYVGAGVLFLPWVPNFIYQATHTGAPWAPPPRFGAPVLISRDLMGGDRITVALVLAAVIGLATLFTRRYRRTTESTMAWALVTLPVSTLLLAWLASQVTPAFVSRYFAPILAAFLLLAAWGGPRRDRRAGRDRALAPVRGPYRVVLAAEQERHARHRWRDDGAPALERGRRERAAGFHAACLVLPTGRGARLPDDDRPGEGPELHGLGVRAQALATCQSTGVAATAGC